MIYLDYFDTPVGTLAIQASQQGICSIAYCATKDKAIQPHSMVEQCKQQLQEYFEHQRTTFDLPLDQQGTAFQLSVWSALKTIPYGQTTSYGNIAQAINNPKSVRAVGGANNKNTLSIVVPCHRVIGSDGALVGYAGGLERKIWLLKHEGLRIDSEQQITLF